MKRTPIVMSATVFGTAAILGFHAHQPSVPLAAASTSTSTSASSSSSTSTSSRSAGTSGTAASTGSGNGTALGDPMNTRYGIAQVRVTVSGGKITKIEAVQLQNGDPKSAAISSYAE